MSWQKHNFFHTVRDLTLTQLHEYSNVQYRMFWKCNRLQRYILRGLNPQGIQRGSIKKEEEEKKA